MRGMLRARMRTPVIAIFALLACGAEAESSPQGERSIEFLVPGTLEPLAEDTAVEIYVRSQGAYGTEVDIRVYGVALGDQAPFTVGCLDPGAHELAAQKFLPTSTAVEQEDGSFTIAKLPVVFFDEVQEQQVAEAPAILRATMMTSPVTVGELPVVLSLQNAPSTGTGTDTGTE